MRAIGRAVVVLGRTVAEAITIGHATCLVCPDRPAVRAANFAAEIKVASPADAELTLGQVQQHFARRGLICWALYAADGPSTRWIADVAVRDGYQATSRCVLRLERFAPEPTDLRLQIIPARAAYRELRSLLTRWVGQAYDAGDRLVTDLTETFIDQLDEPRLDMFLGRVDRQPVVVAGVLSLGQVGVIQYAQGLLQEVGPKIATVLMSHLLEHCQRAQFEQVIVDLAAGSSQIRFFESLGFKVAGSYVRLDREAAAPP